MSVRPDARLGQKPALTSPRHEAAPLKRDHATWLSPIRGPSALEKASAVALTS